VAFEAAETAGEVKVHSAAAAASAAAVAAAVAVEADKVQAEEIAVRSRAAAAAVTAAVPALDIVVPVRLLELPDVPLGAGVLAEAGEVAAGEEAAEAGEQKEACPVLIVPGSNPYTCNTTSLHPRPSTGTLRPEPCIPKPKP
jgi:hypothetical protein